MMIQTTGGQHEDPIEFMLERILARRMHQQQQSAAARKDDGRGARQFQQHHRGLPGRHTSALQLVAPKRQGRRGALLGLQAPNLRP